MVFFIGMFICNLLMPLLMIIAGYMMYKHPPKEINGVIGYRTTRSRKNIDTWKFAHDYCGRLWFKAGFALLIPTIIAQIPFVKSSDSTIGWVTIVIEMIQRVVLIGSIFPVEKALKENFDDNGNKLKSYEERCVEYMQDYFEKDRYNFSQLIDEIRIMKVVDDVIIDKETGIEIYEGNKVPKDILIGILQEFSAMDNLVQDECKNEYEEKDFSIDNYLFAPAWIRVSDNEVVVGYWGIKVNSSFDKVFVKKDGKWKMKL